MTRAGQTKRPCRRIVQTMHGEYVVEVRADECVMWRLRARNRTGAIAVKWGAVYLSVFQPPKRRRAR